MPTSRSHVRKSHKLAAVIGVLAVAIVGVSSLIFHLLDNTDCERYNYNDMLNGGIKNFKDKKYTINICGSGVNKSHFFGNSMDAVQLTITDEQGKVLAKRRYKVFWDGKPGHEPITIGQDRITYQDDEKQQDYAITMPPTVIDRVRAMLPFLN